MLSLRQTAVSWYSLRQRKSILSAPFHRWQKRSEHKKYAVNKQKYELKNFDYFYSK